MLTSAPTKEYESGSSVHLNDRMDTNGPAEVGKHGKCPVDRDLQRPSKAIVNYLMERVVEFRELSELRQKASDI